MNEKIVEWVFSGIGSSIISAIISFFIGGVSGYKICKHRSKIKQTQKASSSAKQKQIGSKPQNGNVGNRITQKQEAKDNAEQIQIGEQ